MEGTGAVVWWAGGGADLLVLLADAGLQLGELRVGELHQPASHVLDRMGADDLAARCLPLGFRPLEACTLGALGFEALLGDAQLAVGALQRNLRRVQLGAAA